MGRHGTHAIALSLLLLSAVGLQAGSRKHQDSNTVEDRQSEKTKEIADRIFYREAKFIQDLKSYTPMVETYIQDFKGDRGTGAGAEQRQVFHWASGHEERHRELVIPEQREVVAPVSSWKN